MRFLADVGVSVSTVRSLRAEGHDAVHLREENLHRLPDSAILAKARDENRTIITFDLDFGDLLAAAGIRLPSVVIFRLHNQTPLSVTRKLLEILPLVRTKLETGAVIIVEESRFRVRELPIVLE